MTSNLAFKVRSRFIQRQITQKRYKIELYFYVGPIESCMICRTAPLSMILNDAYKYVYVMLHLVSRSRYSLTLNISETVRDTDIYSLNGILGTTPYSTVSFRMNLCLEWHSKICDDMKHRAASLRQQSYLLCLRSLCAAAEALCLRLLHPGFYPVLWVFQFLSFRMILNGFRWNFTNMLKTLNA